MKHFLVGLLIVLLGLVACGPATPRETTASGDATGAEGITTETGLRYIELEEGTGPAPQPGDIVQVHYTGTLEDGTEFDSSRDRDPLSFPLGQGNVIPGWDEGIGLMNVGGKARLIIPPQLAYGAQGAGDVIPPNSTLIFEVELVGIEEAPTPVPVPTAGPTPTADPNEVVTGSGLRYIVLEEGDGPALETGDVVQVHYVGTLVDGTQFDSSRESGRPFAFPLGQGRVIPGWDEGIALLNVGSKARLIVPPELAYGDQGTPSIPPNSTLIFEVDVLDILPGSPDEPTAVDEADYTTTETGLKYYDLEPGDGGAPEAGQQVEVHYTAWLEDGTKFDSSLDTGRPIPFIVGSGQPIPGWDEGISTMQFGGKRQLVIPPDLAFGEQGAGGIIPPNATLIFEVELIPQPVE